MKNALLIGLLLLTGSLLAQTGKVVGVVNADEGPLVYAAISLANTNQTVLSDQKGSFIIDKLPAGKYELVVGYLGYSDYYYFVMLIITPLGLKVPDMQSIVKLNIMTQYYGRAYSSIPIISFLEGDQRKL